MHFMQPVWTSLYVGGKTIVRVLKGNLTVGWLGHLQIYNEYQNHLAYLRNESNWGSPGREKPKIAIDICKAKFLSENVSFRPALFTS